MKTICHDYVQTASGIAFRPLNPRIEDVRIEDLAHQLAAANRFAGATREPYSVAQHSIIVSDALVDKGVKAQLYGLLHDASEAYLGDVPRPLKWQDAFAGYRMAEAKLQGVIYEAFGLCPLSEPAALKLADRRALRTEQRDLMPPALPDDDRTDVKPFEFTIVPWSFRAAREAFEDHLRALLRTR